MAHIICIIGNKGGTGKTTLSHMLCQGFGLLGQRSVCILTDASRERLSPEGRRYLTADGRRREVLQQIVDKIRSLDDWVGVIDGGGNRTDVDQRLYALSDVCLLPFRDSPEDIRSLYRDLELFPEAWPLPSQWPSNTWARESAEKMMASCLEQHEHRILKPVFALSSSKLLLQQQIPETLPTPLANACRNLARQVATLFPDKAP